MNWASIKAIVAILALLLIGGCTSHGGTVNFTSTDQSHTLAASFAQAYVAQGAAGEYDIVLLDSDSDWQQPARSKHNAPLQPVPLASLRQVMHIHLYWRPLIGTTRNPAAINASIDWYVLGPDGSNDMIVYSGAGLVAMSPSGDVRNVFIKDGQMTPRRHSGVLHDPIGPAHIEGKLVARRNDARVRDSIAQMRRQEQQLQAAAQ